MKKALLIIAIIFLFFNFVSAEESEVIGVDHNQPIIQELVEGVQNLSQQIFDRVDSITKIITNEVERRQKIIEDQIEERKENLLTAIKNEIEEVINSLIQSTFDSIEDSLKMDNPKTGDVD
ncbi:MAG: hypothetical protein ACQEP3_00295 [Patescibacteria group bacterium]